MVFFLVLKITKDDVSPTIIGIPGKDLLKCCKTNGCYGGLVIPKCHPVLL